MMATAGIMASPIHRDHHFISQSPQQAYSNERSRPFNYTTPTLVTQNLPHTSPSITTPSTFQKPGAMQSPPSPPADDSSKPSLPSISSLLSMTGKEQRQDSPVQHAASQSVASQQSFHYAQSRSVPSTPSEYRPVSHSQGYMDHRGAPLGVTLPPTPPLGPDSEGQPSPSVYSSHSAYPPSPFHVTHKQPPPLLRTTSSTSVYTTSSFAQSPFPSSASAYFPSHSVSAQPVGIYAQRPLPSNFPPPMHIQSLGSQVAPNPWQHHHYISASSQSAFPQPPDRYVCPTCNKAFSRPSSLRIHSHSHTGEKPFKCSHIGCGKAFSVRSNMKRHERGCHAAGGSGSTSS